MEQSLNLSKRCSYQEPSSFSPVIHRCQSSWLGRSIISCSLNPRPITTPYQSSRNDGHNSCLETSTPSHNQFNSLSLNRQLNCCSFDDKAELILQIFFSRSVKHTHLVSTKQDMSSNQTHSRKIQHTCRSSVQTKKQKKQKKKKKTVSTEWSLNQSFVNAIFHMTKFPNIDLFVTLLNHRLSIYMSPIRYEKALTIDALSMDWNCIHAYAFPPFHLIQAVLPKIHQSQCKVVLIAPLWPWFPELLNLLISPPITLPAGLDDSVGCAVRLETRRLLV